MQEQFPYWICTAASIAQISPWSVPSTHSAPKPLHMLQNKGGVFNLRTFRLWKVSTRVSEQVTSAPETSVLFICLSKSQVEKVHFITALFKLPCICLLSRWNIFENILLSCSLYNSSTGYRFVFFLMVFSTTPLLIWIHAQKPSVVILCQNNVLYFLSSRLPATMPPVFSLACSRSLQLNR